MTTCMVGQGFTVAQRMEHLKSRLLICWRNRTSAHALTYVSAFPSKEILFELVTVGGVISFKGLRDRLRGTVDLFRRAQGANFSLKRMHNQILRWACAG